MLAVGKEARIPFSVGGPGELLRLAGLMIVEEKIARAGIGGEAVILRGVAEDRRSESRLFVGELTQAGAVALHHPGIHRLGFLLGVLLPLEVNLLAVSRPADLGRLVADQLRALHDVVDRQGKSLGGLGLEEEQGQPEGQEKFAHNLVMIARA